MAKTRRDLIEKLITLRNPEMDKLSTFSEAYKKYFDAFEKSPRARILGGISDEDKLALGECLSNTLLESNNQSKLGIDPLLALDVVTAVFGNSVLPLFTSEQPLQDKQGAIYYENIVAKSTRGNVTEGQKLAMGASAKEVYPVGYASDGIYNVALGTGTGSQTTFSLDFGAKNIKPNYVSVQVVGADGKVKATITDDGNKHLVGPNVYGTVDYALGTGSLTFGTAPLATDKLVGNVATDFENDGSQIPSINVEYETKIVKAHTYLLQADTSILASFISKKRLGIDANKRAVEVLQQQILREITNDAIKRIAMTTNADPLKNTTFDLAHGSGISVQAHLNTFGLTHAKVQNKMASVSGRGNFGAILAGTEFCEFLTGLNEFKQEGTITDDPSFFGTLGGRYGNVKVVRCPQLHKLTEVEDDKKSAICVYQNSKIDAAAIFAPFMPMTIASDIPVADNLTQRRSLIASMATTEVVNDKYLQKVSLVNSVNNIIPGSEQSPLFTKAVTE